MNDDDLLTAVKEDFAAVRMEVPAELILAGGISRRRRRRGVHGLALAAVFAAGLGLGIPALTSAASRPGASAGHANAIAQRSGHAAHARDATLAAWAVARQPDGAVAVTIRDLRNIAGLQQRLDAAGVHAVVYARVRVLPGCLNWQGGSYLGAVVTTRAVLGPDDVYFVIHPAAIPRGSTLQVDVLPPGWPPPKSAPRQRPQKTPSVGGVGFNGGGPTALDVPSINLSLIYTNSSCS